MVTDRRWNGGKALDRPSERFRAAPVARKEICSVVQARIEHKMLLAPAGGSSPRRDRCPILTADTETGISRALDQRRGVTSLCGEETTAI